MSAKKLINEWKFPDSGRKYYFWRKKSKGDLTWTKMHFFYKVFGQTSNHKKLTKFSHYMPENHVNQYAVHHIWNDVSWTP